MTTTPMRTLHEPLSDSTVGRSMPTPDHRRLAAADWRRLRESVDRLGSSNPAVLDPIERGQHVARPDFSTQEVNRRASAQ